MKRELLFNSLPPEIRVALLEDGVPAEIFVERSRTPAILGNVYRGRIRNVLPGMQSAFVDVGLERDAFLYVTDLFLPADREETAAPEVPPSSRPFLGRGPAIEDLLRENQEVLVQVTKEAMGSKGPRVTTQISIPGRRLVFLPGTSHRAVSRRIEEVEERQRLLTIVSRLPGSGGFIVRTAARNSSSRALEMEAAGLRTEWEQILQTSPGAPVPVCVRTEADLAVRVLRDLFTEEIERVRIDEERTYRHCRDYAERHLPDLAPRIERYSGAEPIFEAFGVEKALSRALRRRVWLPSGGSIVVHPTEALVAIDVNTGKYVGKARFEETALKTNLEAVREIVRQIRLRDLGGILVIDFIDLEEAESREQLTQALDAELKGDRAKSRVLQISDFGLVEITRQRVRRSLETLLCRSCPTCKGSGRVRSPVTLRFDIQRQIRKLLPLLKEGTVTLRAHPDVAAIVQEDLRAFQDDLEGAGSLALRIEPVADFQPEQFEILTG